MTETNQEKIIKILTDREKESKTATLTAIVKEAMFKMLECGDGVKTVSSSDNFYTAVKCVEDNVVCMSYGTTHTIDEVKGMYIKRGDMELIYDENKFKS